MNIGAVLVLLKLIKDAGVAVSPIGPPAPPTGVEAFETGGYQEVRPMCGPGKYAYQHPRTGMWTCKPRPPGR
jgi:hypothetical protein